MSDHQIWKERVNSTVIRANDAQVDVSNWANLEGCSFVFTRGKECVTICAGSLRYEDVDLLIAALSMHRSNA